MDLGKIPFTKQQDFFLVSFYRKILPICHRGGGQKCAAAKGILSSRLFSRKMAAFYYNKFLQQKRPGAWNPGAKCKIQSI